MASNCFSELFLQKNIKRWKIFLSQFYFLKFRKKETESIITMKKEGGIHSQTGNGYIIEKFIF
jgi:hypothetical protein